MKQTLAAFALFLSLAAQAQTNVTEKGDKYFVEATNTIFSARDYASALFAKAFNEYQLTKHYRKMNECVIGIATVEYLNGNFIQALNKLQDARKRHEAYCTDDPEGLRSIKESIDLVQKEIEAASKSMKRSDSAVGLN